MSNAVTEDGGGVRADWMRRVLGVDLGAGRSTGPLLPIWTEAKDALDLRIAALQRALRDAGHPTGLAIAEKGLPGVTRNTMTPLVAALIDYDRADPAGRAKAAAKLREAAGRLRQRVVSERVFAFIDRNPFGVPIASESGITEALDTIVKRLGGETQA